LDNIVKTNKVPICTLANQPRIPEHCILYVLEKEWIDLKPFDGANFDADIDEHIYYVLDKSLERANKFNIKGVTLELTQSTVKNIIPAIASTNAIIAGICANEAFKFISKC